MSYLPNIIFALKLLALQGATFVTCSGTATSEQWQETWTEITATAPGGKVTGKHVKSVVARRLQAASGEKTEPQPQQPLQGIVNLREQVQN